MIESGTCPFFVDVARLLLLVEVLDEVALVVPFLRPACPPLTPTTAAGDNREFDEVLPLPLPFMTARFLINGVVILTTCSSSPSYSPLNSEDEACSWAATKKGDFMVVG